MIGAFGGGLLVLLGLAAGVVAIYAAGRAALFYGVIAVLGIFGGWWWIAVSVARMVGP